MTFLVQLQMPAAVIITNARTKQTTPSLNWGGGAGEGGGVGG